MKRWKAGKRDWRSWAVGSTLIILFLLQLLVMPSAVQAATANNDTVAPVNVAPSFTKGTNQTVLEDCGSQTVSEWATSMSAGPADEAGQTLDFVVTNDNNALFSVQPTVAANGTLTYMPATNGNGMATVTVSLHDNGGTVDGGVNTSTPQTFTITVTPVNDAPVAVPDSYTTAENTVLIVATPGVLANDTDVDGQTLTAAIDVSNYPSHGTAILQPDGSFKYTPYLNYCGPDEFKYRASDEVVRTTLTKVSLQVTAVNHPPYGITLSKATITENLPAGTQVGYFLTQDIEGNVGFTYSLSGPGAAVLAMTNGNYLVTTQALDHETQPAYTLHVRTTDAGGLWYETDFVISVTDVNDVPSFTKGADQTVLEDCGAQTVALWATSISAGPVDEAGQVLNFIVTNDNNPLFAVQPAVAANGTLTYAPAANANGTATVTVRIHDDGGTANGGVDTSVAQTFTITVTVVNDPPVDTYTVTYTAGANGTISGTSPQTVNQGASSTAVTATPDTGYHFVSWSDGSLTAARTDTNVTVNINTTASFAVDTFAITVISGSHGTATPGTGLLSCHAVQAYVVKPDAGYMVDTLTVDGVVVNEATNRLDYTVTLISIEAPHTIVATFASIPDLTAPVNDVPSFTKGPDQTVLEDCGLQTVAGWATSISAGPADESGQALNFIVTNDNTTLFSTQPAVAANGTLTFTPAADASGTAIVTLALTDDATAGSSALTTASQSFTITVTKVADIVDDTAVTTHVPANDNFEDTNRHVSAFTPPSHGAGVINAGSTIGNTPVAPFPVSPRHTMVLTIDIKTMTVDSARVVLDAPAAIVEDRTLVPLRAVVEHLGGSIVWDAKTRQVTLKARGTTIILTIGKSTALVNGKSLAIDPKNSKVVPVLSSSRTMLPLRFVSENLGLQVGWDAETRTITVNWED
ncbi:tandem-95 repeat protein [Candidatus Cryosericum odellii]|uniref:Tandem-95 repeat protein n=2 Tax=Candidatus Cryosericum odellii TaxID=2290917 RepID=A0A398D7K6_9BACT|nr:stalk domain-containing protein [Candidatus Cryosericum odellii]RIE07094.1 tandem-95 repeat protein [Candidatus Cryosericum odellii]